MWTDGTGKNMHNLELSGSLIKMQIKMICDNHLTGIEGENNYISGLVIKNPNAKLIVNGQVIETK